MDFSNVFNGISDTARRTPDALAVRIGTIEVTYSELMRRSSSLALALRDRGVNGKSRVAIRLERSVDLIIAILGVLGSGAAFVPIDPDFTHARQQQVLKHCSASILLSLELDFEFEFDECCLYQPKEWPKETSSSVLRENGIAYIIYTSGTSGRPKGAIVHDDSLTNYISWALESLTFTGGGVPLFTSIAFDFSVTALFPPLLAGEFIDLLPTAQGAHALSDSLLHGHHYSYVKLTPSHARILSAEDRAELGMSASTIVFGGERLSGELVRQLRKKAPDLEVINHYGPTEATVGCLTFRVPKRWDIATVPIGFAMHGVSTLISREDVSYDNSIGELLISGACLAAGYYNNEQETTKAFIHLPHADGSLGRWYKTGDLVKQLGDGSLEFVGRVDDQTKILGHRVEPREIEDALRLHTMISDAAVFPNSNGDIVQLFAAVSSAPTLSEAEVRYHLRSLVSAVMIPSHILLVETLPLMENGKVDRPVIIEACLRNVKQTVNNSTIEGQLLEKWRSVLNDDNLTIDHDFFEVGGDSLNEIDMCIWASEYFSKEVSPVAIFEYPTVRQFAGHIASIGSEPSDLEQP